MIHAGRFFGVFSLLLMLHLGIASALGYPVVLDERFVLAFFAWIGAALSVTALLSLRD